MIYICATCGAIHPREAERCLDCKYDTVMTYSQFLQPEMLIVGGNYKKTMFGPVAEMLPIKDFSYDALVASLTREAIMTNFQLQQTVMFNLGIKEYEIVDAMPEEDLPLHLNDKWRTDIGAEALRYRLTGEGNIEYPDKEYYTSRYLVKAGKMMVM